jgi:hypothetical protein
MSHCSCLHNHQQQRQAAPADGTSYRFWQQTQSVSRKGVGVLRDGSTDLHAAESDAVIAPIGQRSDASRRWRASIIEIEDEGST